MADSEDQDAKEPISNRDRFDRSRRNLLWASSLLFLLAIGFVDLKMIELPVNSIKLSPDKRIIVWCLIAAIGYFYIGFRHDASFVRISNSEAARDYKDLDLLDNINKSSQKLIEKIAEINPIIDGLLSNIGKSKEFSASPDHKVIEKVSGQAREVNELYSKVDELYNQFERDFLTNIGSITQVDQALICKIHRDFRVELRNAVGGMWGQFISGKNLPEGIELAIYLEGNREVKEHINLISAQMQNRLNQIAKEINDNSKMFAKMSNKISRTSKNMLNYYDIMIPNIFSCVSIISGLVSAYFEFTFKNILSIVFP